MNYNRVYNAYFSPSGTTKKITSSVASVISDKITAIDFLCLPNNEIFLDNNDVLVIGMPVFAGRIPQICISFINNLKGNNTPTIILVVYGNRDYEDALIELYDLLLVQNFCVIGAGAFLAEHSVFHEIAKDRPDNNDFSKIIHYSTVCSQKLDSFEGFSEPLSIKGNRPYISKNKLPIRPKASSKCNACGLCANICPTGAIDPEKTSKTNKEKCISCTACIAACPIGARSFKGFAFKTANKVFLKRCSTRLESQWFT